MPIYEYACETCGHHLESLQRITEAPLELCPHCQNNTLKRLVSAAGFRLKGGGWYETDFKNSDQKRNLAKSENEAVNRDVSSGNRESSKGEGSKETKSDANSAAAATSSSSNSSDTKAASSGDKKTTSNSGGSLSKTENKKGADPGSSTKSGGSSSKDSAST